VNDAGILLLVTPDVTRSLGMFSEHENKTFRDSYFSNEKAALINTGIQQLSQLKR
jgi:hypothetical protein